MRVMFGVVLLAVLASSVLATQTDVLELQAVPETAAAARQLLQSSDAVGGYYGTPSAGRGLIQVGGYGYGSDHAHNLVQTGGYGYGRRLVEEEDIVLEPSDPLLEYAEQQLAKADSEQRAAQQAAGGLSAAAVAAMQNSRSSQHTAQLFPIPAGKCYCRYDTDFSTWALAEDSCKDALYSRCKSEANLPCSWLDKFYAPAKGPGHILPHEVDIKAFLYEDCTPQPPCSCTAVNFDGNDPVPLSVACCRDLRVACRTPFSGVDCKKVEAFCSDDKPTRVLAAWSKHVLHHADCSNYKGVPYLFVNLWEMQSSASQQAAVAPQQPAAEALLLKEAIDTLEKTQAAAAAASTGSDQQQRRIMIALAAIAAGAVCVAVVAVVFAMQREDATQPIVSAPSPPLYAADVYQSLIKSTSLTAPKAAACVGASTLYGGAPCGPLRRDGSGESCMSRVISITGSSSQGSGMQEPLLHQHNLSRSVSNGSDTYSTGSTTGDHMP